VIGLAVALRLQLRTREYRAQVYWFAVMMVAVFGTMVADGPHRVLGIPYAVTTPLCAAGVAVIFWHWRRSEGTLSIHSIVTRSRETYYWVAVLATFALGTAAGDLTALSLGLGYFGSILLFGAAIAVPAVAWRRGWMSPTLAFWAAYVVTRPLGASIADWIGKPSAHSGLGLGDGTVSVLALLVFAGLVAYVARTRRDIQAPAAADGHPARRRPIEAQALPAET
jgi:uncharacterized membrane-anchored protein